MTAEPPVNPIADPEENAAQGPEGSAPASESPDAMDTNDVIVEGPMPFPIVGLGASAGGVQVLQTFFEAMPPNSGMAFVVILHLSPEYESNLAALLQAKTAMAVTQVTEPVKVEPNHVYVIPPTQHLSMEDSIIRLSHAERPFGRRVAIDLFFRTLAETHGTDAIAVILSGTGTDGTMGLKRIKERGGVVIVQNPDEAEYKGMPSSAIATDLVDFVLPLAQMPEQLIQLKESQERVRLPGDVAALPSDGAEALVQIFALLRAKTGHDFGQYKRSTVLRRLERRLQVHHLNDLATYARFLRGHAEEVQALLRDMLISVTNFFRDPESFAVLEEEVIPRLFEEKGPNDTVRAWVAGCATGEEAYSIAMLLAEHIAQYAVPPQFQLFATDIDEGALAFAREGLYTDTITADVSPERLQRFFTKEQDRYRVKKEIRERVLFAPHNVLSDPPFSRLDLVTCRNVLIYLQRDVHKRLFQLFHFALLPGGYLFLGASETADAVPNLFLPTERKHHIYQRRAVPRVLPPVAGTPTLLRGLSSEAQGRLPAMRLPGPQPSISFGDLHRELLEPFTPASVIVDDQYDIVHLSPNAGRFLQFSQGEPSHNLLRVIHPDLRMDLRTVLFAAAQKGESTESRQVRVQLRNEPFLVDLIVRPLRELDGARGFILVVFKEIEIEASAEAARELTAPHPLLDQLEEELVRTRERLQATVEEYEASIEELRAANEELQSINEEYQSTTEELETSKEELQSVNEELTTVNQELKNKVDEVSRSNNDLQNLMAASEIATLFIDRSLRIRRYTPSATALFNLISADVGRPLSHVTNQLRYDSLGDDASRVLRELVTLDREVQGNDGRWFLARLRPYRTVEDKIDGIVITLVDISTQKANEAALHESEERQRFLLEFSDALRAWPDEQSIKDQTVKMLAEHLRLDRCWISEVFEQQGISTVGPEHLRPDLPPMSGIFQLSDYPETMRQLVTEPMVIQDTANDARFSDSEKQLLNGFGLRALLIVPLRKGQRAVIWALSASMDTPRLWTDSERVLLEEVAERTWAAVERARAEEALRESEERYRTLFNSIDEGFCIIEALFDENDVPVDYRFLVTNPAFERHTGLVEAVGKTVRELVPGHEAHWFETYGRVARTGEPARFENAAAALHRWYDVYAFRVGAPEERTVAVLFNDISERKRSEEALIESKEYAESIVETIPDPLLVLETDLRVRSANDAFYQTFQVAPAETEGTYIYALGNGQWDIPALRTLLEDILPENNVFTGYEVTHTFEQIGRRTMLLNGRRLDHAQLILLAINDITERARAEEALRQSEERLRLATEAAEMFSWEFDLTEHVSNWSENADLVLDAPMPSTYDEAVERTHPDDRARVKEILDRAIAEGGEFRYEYRVANHPPDEEVWLFSAGMVLTDSNGTATRIVGVTQNITARKQAELEHQQLFDEMERAYVQLEEQRARLALMVEASGTLLSTSLDYPSTVTSIAQLGVALLGDVALVHWLQPEQSTFTTTIAYKNPALEAVASGLRQVLDTTTSDALPREQVVQSGASIFVPEVTDAFLRALARDEAHLALLRALAPTSWITVPIGTDGLRLGALTVLSTRANIQFSPQDLALAEQFAQQAAFAIENARLYRRAQQRLAQSREEERQHLARELHDEIVQQLIGLGYQLRQYTKRPTDSPAADPERLADLRGTLAEAEQQVLGLADTLRGYIADLRPPGLDEYGLTAALEGFASQIEEDLDGAVPQIVLDLDESGTELPPSIALTLFRAVQEGVWNVVRHAEATRVTISLDLMDHEVVLTVRDDGKGFQMPARLSELAQQNHFGLVGISERVELVGGKLSIKSVPDGGMTLAITIPLASEEV